MMEAASHGGQILEARCYVVGAFLKDPSPLILCEVLPCAGLPYWDERRADRFGTTQAWLPGQKAPLLLLIDITIVARDTMKHPCALIRWGGYMPALHIDAGYIGQSRSSDRCDVDHAPCAGRSTNEGK